MEVISRGNNITSGRPAVFETANYLIINTQVYDKASFKPIPLNFVSKDMGGANTMSLYRMIWTYRNNTGGYYLSDMYLRYRNKYIWIDHLEDGAFVKVGHYSDYYIEFAKYKETIEGNKLKLSYVPAQNGINGQWRQIFGGGGSYADWRSGNVDIIHETDQYYVFGYIFYSDDTDYALCRCNKHTMEINWIPVGMGSRVGERWYKLCQSGDDIIYVAQTLYEIVNDKEWESIRIYKITISTNSALMLFEQYKRQCLHSTAVEFDGMFYFLRSNPEPANTLNPTYRLCFDRFQINMSNDTVTMDTVIPNENGLQDELWGEYGAKFEDNFKVYTYNTCVPYVSSNGQKYIIDVVHGSACNDDYMKNMAKIIVFRLNNDLTMDIASVMKFYVGCKGFLEYNEGDFTQIVTLHSGGYRMYKFDEKEETYKLIYEKAGIIYCIGFDMLNRLYVQYNDGTVEVTSSQNAVTLKADFEEESYWKEEYHGLATNIKCYAKNNRDEFIITNVRLTLIGCVEFLDGTRTTEIMLEPEENTIPVMITGKGRIDVVITQVT